MIRPREHYMVDKKGKKVGVFLNLTDYKRMLEALEELEAIRAYDKAKASKSRTIPWEHALATIERKRK